MYSENVKLGVRFPSAYVVSSLERSRAAVAVYCPTITGRGEECTRALHRRHGTNGKLFTLLQASQNEILAYQCGRLV